MGFRVKNVFRFPSDFYDDATDRQRKLGYIGKMSSENTKKYLLKAIEKSNLKNEIFYCFRKTTSVNTHPHVFYLSFIFRSRLFELPIEIYSNGQFFQRGEWIEHYSLYMRLINYDYTNKDPSDEIRRNDTLQFRDSAINNHLLNFYDILSLVFTNTNPFYLDRDKTPFNQPSKSFIHYVVAMYMNFPGYEALNKSREKELRVYKHLHGIMQDLNRLTFIPCVITNPKSLKELAAAVANFNVDDIHTVHEIKDIDEIYTKSLKRKADSDIKLPPKTTFKSKEDFYASLRF
jgi:hypothetical protein